MVKRNTIPTLACTENEASLKLVVSAYNCCLLCRENDGALFNSLLPFASQAYVLPELCKRLIQYGADAKLINLSPILENVVKEPDPAKRSLACQTVELLLERGANPHVEAPEAAAPIGWIGRLLAEYQSKFVDT